MEGLAIGAVARQTNLPTSTLRYYESIGQIAPPSGCTAGAEGGCA